MNESQEKLDIVADFDPSKFRRTEYGLLSTVKYVYNEDGTVNWRRMVDIHDVVVQRDKEQEVLDLYGKKSVAELDLAAVEDKYLLLLLNASKRLLHIRGYSFVRQHVDAVSDFKATVTCTIGYIGNYETEMREVEFSDVGSASIENTTGFGKKYLESIAANRAFVRAVRNFLGINIVGKDEVSETVPDDLPQSGDMYTRILEQQANLAGKTFAQIKEGCLKRAKKEEEQNVEKKTYNGDPSLWNSFADISGADKLTILGQLQEILSKKK